MSDNYLPPFGAILPNQQRNPLDTWMDLQKQQEEQRRYQRQLQMQQEHYNNGVLSDFAEKLNDKHYLTGTPFDPMIQHNLNTALQSVAEHFKNNGNYADGLLKTMSAANEIGAYAEKARNLRRNIEESAKLYQRNPSIDWQRLSKEAMTRASLMVDDNGHLTVKDPNKIDDGFDYVSDVLDRLPEKVTTGLGSLYEQIEKGKYLPYKAKRVVNEKGIDREKAWEGKYDPQYNTLLNNKGEVVTPESMQAVKVGVKGEKLRIGGQDYTGVPDDVMNYFYQDRGTKAAIQGAARNYIRQLGLTDGQKEIEKYLLHRELSNSANSYINPVEDKVSDAALQRQMWHQQNAATNKLIGAIAKGNNPINDVYGRIAQVVANNGGRMTPMQSLGADDQALIINNYLKPLAKGKDENGDVYEPTPEDVNLITDTDGNIGLQLTYDAQQKLGRQRAYLGALPITINLKAPGNNTKGARTQINAQSSTNPAKTTTPQTSNTPSLNATQWKKKKK